MNIPTLLTAVLLAAVVCAIVVCTVKKKGKGGCSCGGNCGNCDHCH